jgi:class 3 adenylate cyclase
MVRLGLHTGDVVVGRIGGDPRQIALALGDTTQVADQLLRQAVPGEIVLSQVTAHLIHGWVRLEGVEPDRRRHSMGLCQFVDREDDLAKLQALLAQMEEGYG